MTTEPASPADGPVRDPSGPFDPGTVGATPAPTSEVGLSDITAGMVLHRVLARSARTFLLNDMGADPAGGSGSSAAILGWTTVDVADTFDAFDTFDTVEALEVVDLGTGHRPLWAQSAATGKRGTRRRATEAERIHQSRVAMRRIRSNLRTFRLALDPTWGTSLRAELAWYGNSLGHSRDLQVIREVIAATGPDLIGPDETARLDEVVAARMVDAAAAVAAERGGARRFQLTEQMMVLWEGPAFSAKAAGPADEVLPPLLRRAWHDLRGAARTARKHPTDANLHRLRIRLKDLRYGCETVALVEGGPARKTAKAAERLQSKLGDLHDAAHAVDWFHSLATERPDLHKPIDVLIEAQTEAGSKARKGWKRELKEVERRWRTWHS
jgi:CHAD domain-containing protein